MIYWQLLLLFIKVGFLGFGGGMAIISLIQNEVLSRGWMTETEFVDIVAISQVTPGPIGINCATYVGYTATGTIWGSLIASGAIILPSLIIMGIICYIYNKISERWQANPIYIWVMRLIRIAVVFLIAHAAWTLITPASFIDNYSWVIYALVIALMLLPDGAKLVEKHLSSPTHSQVSGRAQRVLAFISHPIVLILASGCIGYFLYR